VAAGDVKAWRRGIRSRLIERRLAAPAEERALWSATIEGHLEALLRAAPPAVVAAYWPVRGEFDPRPLVLRLAAEGWRAALPVIGARGAPMIFRAWSAEAAMAEGHYGIPVPADTPEVAPATLLLPLVGFDSGNYRLGYGGGYFDRTLAALAPRPRTIGLGFELARLDTVHPLAHDIPLDLVVTEAGVQARPSTAPPPRGRSGRGG
jgi:5-formyltetrahydrofolate cyclo-ligase